MDTLHELFFAANGILPSLGLNKAEIKKRCHVELEKSFINPTTDFRAFEAVATFLFKLINPEAYKNACIEVIHPTRNRKEEAEWRKACKVFCGETNIPMPSFQIMKQPTGIEVFEYFNTLVDSIGVIQSEQMLMEDRGKIELEADEEMTFELFQEAERELAAEKENGKLLLEEEKQTKLDILQVSQEVENVRLPTENDRKELTEVTNRLQAIHDEAEQFAKSEDLLKITGRRFIAMEKNNLKEIINEGRDCEKIADDLINRQKSSLILTKHSDTVSCLERSVDELKKQKLGITVTHENTSGHVLPKRRDILSDLSNFLQETLDFDPKSDLNGRRTTTWKPIRRDTMAGVAILRSAVKATLREKTPPRCPSPTKRAREESIFVTEINDTDAEFNFFSQKNRANSTGFPGTVANEDDSVNFSDLDLSGIE